MDSPPICDVCKLVDQRDAPCDESGPDRDMHDFLTRAMRSVDEATINVRCSIAPLESHAEMTAAARALAAVSEAREAVHALAREAMRARGHHHV